jgi:hypothetical protein
VELRRGTASSLSCGGEDGFRERADNGESARVEKKIEGGSVPSPRSSTAAEIRRDRNGARVDLARFFFAEKNGESCGGI